MSEVRAFKPRIGDMVDLHGLDTIFDNPKMIKVNSYIYVQNGSSKFAVSQNHSVIENSILCGRIEFIGIEKSTSFFKNIIRKILKRPKYCTIRIIKVQ